MADEFLTVTKVAQHLHVSAESVRAYERAGKLKAFKTTGGTRIFRLCDVEKFARAREQSAIQRYEKTV